MSPKEQYASKLKDPRWQKKRLEVMERAGFKCQACGNKSEMLAVHHQFYVWGSDPWQYPDYCFQCLCNSCHAEVGEDKEANKESGYAFLEMVKATGMDMDGIHDLACHLNDAYRNAVFDAGSGGRLYRAIFDFIVEERKKL